MSKIVQHKENHILRIGFNRPEKRNAFDYDMLLQLSRAMKRLDEDPELWCGLIYAEGDCFTAGLDLADVGPRIMERERTLMPEGEVDPFGTDGKIREKPIVVAVHGLCLTLGIELMLNCDITVAASNTRFGQIEIKRGIYPFGGGTIRWVQAVGWGNAMRYLLTADMLDAKEAYRIGLVQELVDPGEQFDQAMEIAETIVKQAPLGVAATLRNARKALYEGPIAAMRDLIPEAKRLGQTEDAQEGLLSFIERREGRFKGK